MSEQGQSSAGSTDGEVSAEDAESLAAQFRPAWELDEAPFAAGGAVSPEAATALAQTVNGNAGPVAAAPAEFTAPQAIALPPPPKAPSFDAAATVAKPPKPGTGGNGGIHAKTMMGMAAPQMPVASPAPAPAPTFGHAAAPTHAVETGPSGEEERPLFRSERPPAIGVGMYGASVPRGPARPAVVRPIVDAHSASNSDLYAIPRKSSLPMIIGVGAVLVALAGVGIAVKFAFGDAPPKDSTASQSGSQLGQARSKNDIPPPKDEPTAQGPLSQDIPVMKPGSLPKASDTDQPVPQPAAQPAAQPIAAQPVAPARPQPIAAAPVPPQPRANAGAGGAGVQAPQPPKPPKPPKGGGGIVRDSPF